MLIKGAGKKENRLFVQTMPHKRQCVWDLSNYSEQEYLKFQLTFFIMERGNLNYKKEYDPADLSDCPYNVPVQNKCRTCSGYPTLEYCTMFLVILPDGRPAPAPHLSADCGTA